MYKARNDPVAELWLLWELEYLRICTCVLLIFSQLFVFFFKVEKVEVFPNGVVIILKSIGCKLHSPRFKLILF